MSVNQFLQLASRKVREGYAQWIDRRIPPSRQVTLTQKNIFIFPNRHALFYFLVVALIWVAATNYESNLSFGLSFSSGPVMR